MKRLAIFLTAVFISTSAMAAEQNIVLAGGCFWGMEAVYDHIKGVKKAVAGYAGGEVDTAHYEQVSGGDTGHAEAVQITYDPNMVTLDQILKVYFTVAHNPTELNRQGPDSGTQYRSAIFYTNQEQKKTAEDMIEKMSQQKAFKQPIVTKLEPLKEFYPAEEHHQNYAALNPYNPYIMMNDAPKVSKVKEKFPELYKEPNKNR